jgi:hypothetical protein
MQTEGRPHLTESGGTRREGAYPRRGVTTIGQTFPSNRTILVFVGDVRAVLGLKWNDRCLGLVIGRIVALRLNTVRRGIGAHDRSGLFAACADPKDLVRT